MRFASARPDGRSRLVLFLIQGVLVALAATALVARASGESDRVASPARRQATTTTVPPTTTTTIPPPPPRLYFTTGGGERLSSRSIAAGGGDERIEALPVVQSEQISPDGQQIVFSKQTERRKYDCPQADCSYTAERGASLFVANRDGTGERSLTTGGFDDEPAWLSADVIVFRSHRLEPNKREFNQLVMVDLAGRELAALTTPDVTVVAFAIAPDRRSIAYSAVPGREWDKRTYIYDMATGASRELSRQGFEGLTWSPDGAEIAGWRMDSDVFRQEIVKIAATGGPVTVVYGATKRDYGWLNHCESYGGYNVRLGYPVWSPDSTQLAFGSSVAHTGVPSAMLNDIVVINRDGTNLHTVRPASRACSPSGDNHDLLWVRAWR